MILIGIKWNRLNGMLIDGSNRTSLKRKEGVMQTHIRLGTRESDELHW
jgi:hypothetical protein